MRFDADLEERYESAALVDVLEDWYHVPALLAILAYMLWIRVAPYGRFVQSGTVYFRGNDAYYHYRTTMYSVRNWPRRLFADPWSNFPFGTTVGNFGSLMDQAVATVALLVGLGDPTARQVATIAVVAPAVIGTLAAIAAYGIAATLGDSRLGGLTAAALVALVPSSAWVSRSTAGFYDHHVAEALMMAVSVFAIVRAIAVARRERPVYEQVVDRDWTGLRPTVSAAALAGLALGLYLHVWAPGALLVGILGIFTVIAMAHAVVRKQSPEYLAFVGVGIGLVGALVVLPWATDFAFRNAQLSFLQFLMLVGLAAGSAFLAWLARYWDNESFDPVGYPVAVAAIGVVVFGVLWIAVPSVIDSMVGGLNRIVLFEYSVTRGTVGEAQPMNTDDLGSAFYSQYGMAFFTGMVGAIWMAGSALLGQRDRAEYLFVAIWTAFLVSAAITQIRFNYYLVLAVAVTNGWLVAQVFEIVELPSVATPERVEAYQVLTVLAVVLVLFMPITVGLVGANGENTAAGQAQQTGPGSVQDWESNLDWMAESTPEPGQFGGANNSMSYYGPFEDTGDHEYPDGAYGVMSWWDYGHWITVEGERIPNANPFQEGPRIASEYLQAQNETRANLLLEALPTTEGGADLRGKSTEELRAIANNATEQEASEETRYVMIDGQMAGGKFDPITAWAGPDVGEYRPHQSYQVGNESVRLRGIGESYDRTMLSELYFQDAQGLEHYRLVKESRTPTVIASAAVRDRNGVWQEQFVGLDLRTIAQYFPAYQEPILQQLQNPQAETNPNVKIYDLRRESAVKTFERVEGATITGEAEPGEPVTIAVPVQTDTGREFTYTQEVQAGEDGSFEATVPYATDNQWGPEDGYTDAAAVGNGSYTVLSNLSREDVQRTRQTVQLRALQQGERLTSAEVLDRVRLYADSAGDAAVPEPAIYQGEEIDVELETTEDPGNVSQTNQSQTNQSQSNATASGSNPGAASDGGLDGASSAPTGTANSAATASGSAAGATAVRAETASSGG